MKKLHNNEYVNMTEEEIAEYNASIDDEVATEQDKVEILAEGLSNAQTLAQVRASAKAVLGGA